MLTTEIIKFKLSHPGLMYNSHVNHERYTEAVGGKAWSSKMRQTVADDIYLNGRICFINELTLEQCNQQCRADILIIPLFVVLHFVEFLCHRHIDTSLAQAALEELQVLVHHDQGVFVPVHLRDISWEILGICHQMTGNLRAAFFSYQQFLTQCPVNRIQNATEMRLQDLHIK